MKQRAQADKSESGAWSQAELAHVERFSYKSADDWDIDGFLVKPSAGVRGRSTLHPQCSRGAGWTIWR
jgi:hypothetical protein